MAVTVDLAIIISIFIFVITAMVLGAIFSGRKQAAHEEEWKRAASARGWKRLEKALVDASNDKTSVLSEEDRPWVLLRPNAISLARIERYRDIQELDGFVRAGVALTRAFTFGRRSLS